MLRNAITVLAALAAAAGSAQAAAPQRSPLLGVWRLEVSRLPLPRGVRGPRSVTLVVSTVGQGRWKTTIDTVNADGTARRAQATYRTDGTPAAVADTMGGEVDTVSITCPNPSTLVMGATLRGHWSTTRVFTVAPGGKHQTETILWLGPDGKPHTRTNTWTRE